MNKMAFIKQLSFLIFLVFIASCNKDNLPGPITSGPTLHVHIDVVECCNPWGDNIYEISELAEKVIDFMASENILVQEIEIEDSGAPLILCISCCECPSGRVVNLEIFEGDLERAMELGFEE